MEVRREGKEEDRKKGGGKKRKRGEKEPRRDEKVQHRHRERGGFQRTLLFLF